jgi:hypothetical protein
VGKIAPQKLGQRKNGEREVERKREAVDESRVLAVLSQRKVEPFPADRVKRYIRASGVKGTTDFALPLQYPPQRVRVY